ncbi:dephospho-CoA kinase [Arenibacter nanhaiticus]|uniref:Dephospho-CoA kinase n=1 Tax=Arenibacter nanhaiticus TaxID=558155 RepID=A0A1M6K2S8_9FLAO|nr:dephospho-CoA kinase [Arenibacter nanhaiticus]SHJ53266.1 dephospho-CoA kinase [Arenibacter nanhaiticus]
MKIVGLTGGIGSGKSTVGAMFQALGVPVYNSDVQAKILMAESKELQEDIRGLLGAESYENGVLNRTFIANKVFKDKELLQALNRIVHPAVRQHFLQWAKKQNAAYVIQEAAIIFENNSVDFYDKIILVTAPKEDRVNRVVKRDQVEAKKVEDRMKNQWPDQKKEEVSDFVIHNTDLEQTLKEVQRVHKILLKM